MSQGWSVNATTDVITFLEPVASGTNNIVIEEIPDGSFNASSIWALGAWNDSYGYPSEIEFFADRLIVGATTDQPQTLWFSRIGDYSMFGKSTPIVDDDSITATLNARQLNKIRDFVPLASLVVLTSGGEWRANGDNTEALTPSSIGFRPQTSMGSSKLPALLVSQVGLYAQNLGFGIQELSYSFQDDGYSGTDLSAFSSHLVEYYKLTDWCYQSVPSSSAFAVREDGILLCMTYKREHRVVAWSRQTTAGQVLSVTTVREGKENAMYQAVRRTINGATKVFIERYGDQVLDTREWIGSDCALQYDGRNATSTTISLSASGWTSDDTITMTASAGIFSASNIGDQIVLNYSGELVRISILAYTSATVVAGRADRDIPVELRTPGTNWALAVDTLSGLSHLEGATVRIGCDGYDCASQVVSGGQITIEPAVLVTVGLPYVCDFESLPLNVIGGQPVGGRQKLVRELDLMVRNTATINAGTSFDNLEEYAARADESPYQTATLKTGNIKMNLSGAWSQDSHVCIRHDSAYPATILAISPTVEFGK